MSLTASAPRAAQVQIGIIGMGDMGRMYARRLSGAGYIINACDREERFESLKEEYKDAPLVNIFKNGHYVSRLSDYIIYSVEAENIDKIVAAYGPSTKVGAIVGGQTSCKAPEIAAFEAHLPADVEIVSCHSLHGPNVDTRGQPLVLIQHRASDESLELVKSIFTCFNSQYVYLTAQAHDKITADTQAATHAAFMSMGVAWHANNQFPWEVPRYVGGIENVKINISLRIYCNKWHVYAGLAIMNPAAHDQILQYAQSVTDLFTLMIEHKKDEFRQRIFSARDYVFGGLPDDHELLLSDDLLDKFSLSNVPADARTPNSHLSLLAMVDCWWKLGIVPYDHMICSTPLFRIWLGVTEYLFQSPGLLEDCIKVALENDTFRADDLEFTMAARSWSDIITFRNFDLYQKKFERTQKYFSPRFPDATKLGNEMIKTIFEKTKQKKV
ncbi:hypothetical protein BZA70DRAFT_255881 [Myxozyma melibiosi]|uniref:Prephenate dehydrogenase [NADP(+)] n=1 Tax=Myxozyma melibiosi TaxID=54550 RepID=A0ABR1F8G5_9ASCO